VKQPTDVIRDCFFECVQTSDLSVCHIFQLVGTVLVIAPTTVQISLVPNLKLTTKRRRNQSLWLHNSGQFSSLWPCLHCNQAVFQSTDWRSDLWTSVSNRWPLGLLLCGECSWAMGQLNSVTFQRTQLSGWEIWLHRNNKGLWHWTCTLLACSIRPRWQQIVDGTFKKNNWMLVVSFLCQSWLATYQRSRLTDGGILLCRNNDGPRHWKDTLLTCQCPCSQKW